jgi:hypothetical protein
MLRSLLLVALLGFAAASPADGPGSRIGIGPPLQTGRPAAERDLQRCQAMRGEEKDRCMKNLRAAAAADEKARGPEATGAGPSAGSGTAGGTSSGTSSGAAPR